MSSHCHCFAVSLDKSLLSFFYLYNRLSKIPSTSVSQVLDVTLNDLPRPGDFVSVRQGHSALSRRERGCPEKRYGVSVSRKQRYFCMARKLGLDSWVLTNLLSCLGPPRPEGGAKETWALGVP